VQRLPGPPGPPPGKPPMTDLSSRKAALADVLRQKEANKQKVPPPIKKTTKQTVQVNQKNSVVRANKGKSFKGPKQRNVPASNQNPHGFPAPKGNLLGFPESTKNPPKSKPAPNPIKTKQDQPKPQAKVQTKSQENQSTGVVDLSKQAPEMPPGLGGSTIKRQGRKPNRRKRKKPGKKDVGAPNQTQGQQFGQYQNQYEKQYEENDWFGEPYYEEEKFHDTFWDEDPYYNQTQNEEFEVNYSQYEAPYQEPKSTYGKAIEDFEIDYEKEVATNFRGDYYEKQWTNDRPQRESGRYTAFEVRRETDRSETSRGATEKVRSIVRNDPPIAPKPVAPKPVAPKRSLTPENIAMPVQTNDKPLQEQQHTMVQIRRIRRRQKTPPVVRAPPHLELQQPTKAKSTPASVLIGSRTSDNTPFAGPLDPEEQKKIEEAKELTEMCHRIDAFIAEKFASKISMNRPKPTMDNPNCYVSKITMTSKEDILIDFLSEFIDDDSLLNIWGRGNVKPQTMRVRNYVVTLKFKKAIDDFVLIARDVGLMVHIMPLEKWLRIEQERAREAMDPEERERESKLRARERERNRRRRRVESYPPPNFENEPPDVPTSIQNPSRRNSRQRENHLGSRSSPEVIVLDQGSPSPPKFLKKIEKAEDSPEPPSVLKKFEDSPEIRKFESESASSKLEDNFRASKFEDAPLLDRSPSPEKTRFSPLTPPPPPPPSPPPSRSRRSRRSQSPRHRERDRGRRFRSRERDHKRRSRDREKRRSRGLEHEKRRSREREHEKRRSREREKRKRFRSSPSNKDSLLTRFPSPSKRGPPTEFPSQSKRSRSSDRKRKKKEEKRKKDSDKKRSSPLALGFRHWEKEKKKAKSRSRSSDRKRRRRSRSRERSKKKKKKKAKSKHNLRDSAPVSPQQKPHKAAESTEGVIDLTDEPKRTLYNPALATTQSKPVDPTKAGFMPVSTQNPYAQPQAMYYDPNHGYYSAPYQQQTNPYQPIQSQAGPVFDDELFDLLPDLDDDETDGGGGPTNPVLQKINALKEKQDTRRKTLLAQMAQKLDNYRNVRGHEMPQSMFDQFYLKVCGTKEACEEYHRACQVHRVEEHIRED